MQTHHSEPTPWDEELAAAVEIIEDLPVDETSGWDADLAAAVTILDDLPAVETAEPSKHRFRQVNLASDGDSNNRHIKQDGLLIGMPMAAQLLGYSIPGLSKIVNRTRRRLAGEPVAGPTIQFLQAGRKSPIKFRREWIEQFIREHSRDPSKVATETEKPLPESRPRNTDFLPPHVGRHLGFDPSLYDI